MYNYREAVEKDIREWMEENPELWESEDDMDEVYEIISEAVWTADSVTGNASGSYTFNRFRARQYFFEDENSDEYISDMINAGFIASQDFAGAVSESNWEAIDVSIRCYLVSECLSKILDEMK